MAGFDDACTAVAGTRDGDPVSAQLRPLLRQVYADVLAPPLSLVALKNKSDSFARIPKRTGSNERKLLGH
jgi:hypothetical protein